MKVPVVCSIGCSDPWNAAGTGLDILALRDCGVRPVSVVAGVTAQDRRGVAAAEPVSAHLVRAQLQSLAEAGAAAVRVGALLDAATVAAVAEWVERAGLPTVYDPVLAPSGGGRFADEATLAAIVRELLPRVTLLTPNLAEARVIASAGAKRAAGAKGAAGATRATDARRAAGGLAAVRAEPDDTAPDERIAPRVRLAPAAQLERAARDVAALGAVAVLVTGGDLARSEEPARSQEPAQLVQPARPAQPAYPAQLARPAEWAIDVLVDGTGSVAYEAPRFTGTMRGTGCLLTCGIAAALAHGADLREAVAAGRAFVRARFETALEAGGMRLAY